MKPLLTLAQVAEQLQCSERTVRRLIAEGQLRRIRLRPRVVRVNSDDLARFLEKASALECPSTDFGNPGFSISPRPHDDFAERLTKALHGHRRAGRQRPQKVATRPN